MRDSQDSWAGRSQWRIFTTAFDKGQGFLRAWKAWQDDPRRSAVLHYVAQEPWPATATELVAAAEAPIRPLAEQMARQWWGLVPGVHRLSFERGAVLLTLHVGLPDDTVRELSFTADELRLNDAQAVTRSAHAIRALARLCRRGTRLVAHAADEALRHDLVSCGFQLRSDSGSATLRAVYDPAWAHKLLRAAEPVRAGDCLVIGGGLAGAAAAAALARRGWQVQVLDQAEAPAAGASGLPAGLMAPHLSPDDNLLSRLSRAGVRMCLNEAAELLNAGDEWQGEGGTMEHRRPAQARPLEAQGFAPDWSRPAAPDELCAAMLPPDANAVCHPHAAWIKPAALVRAWLAQPRIDWRGGACVAQLERSGSRWRALDAQGAELGQASLVVIAAALGSAALAGQRLWLQPVRGQVSWGLHGRGLAMPQTPLNGNGHLLPRVPLPEGLAWLCGSSYGRGDTGLDERADDHRANYERLQTLAPWVASQLAPQFMAGQTRSWTGVRCASADRRPLVGEIEPGLWVSTAMGSRGLTFAALCGELIAARLHDEPLPLPLSLASAIDVRRQLASDA